MASLTLPIFSLPKTRAEHSATILKLSTAFQSQGLSVNNANTMASQLISYKEQGLTDAQILKNFDQTFQADAKRFAENQKKIDEAKARQQPLLDALAKAQADRKTLATKTGDAESRTKEQIRDFNKNKTVMVANPKNPKGALIPFELAKQYEKELEISGGLKEQNQSSLTQKSNPSIIESIRNLVTTQKTVVTVIGLNKTYVQLSDGNLIPRSQYKGVIPQKFLDAEKITTTSKPVTPDNAPFGGVTTKGGAKIVIDPTKTTATASKTSDASKSTPAIQTVELPANVKAQLDFLKSLNPKLEPKIFDPLGDLAKALGLAFNQGSDALAKTTAEIQKNLENLSKSTETKTDDTTKPFDPLGDLQKYLAGLSQLPKADNPTDTTKPFDPLGDLGKYFLSLIPKSNTTPKIIDNPVAGETCKDRQSRLARDNPNVQFDFIPCPQEPNKPVTTEPTITTEPTTNIAKAMKYISDNGVKIAVGGLVLISGIGMLMALSRNQRNEILERYR